jgi:hypothetical protein
MPELRLQLLHVRVRDLVEAWIPEERNQGDPSAKAG